MNAAPGHADRPEPDHPHPDGASRTDVVPVDLRISTAYAVGGGPGRGRWVLVDTGPAGAEHRLLRALDRVGITGDDIGLVVLTHCHPDHAGGAAHLQRELRVPVAVHQAEAGWAATGVGEFYRPLRPFGRLLLRTLAPTFPAVDPDVVLDDGADLTAYGAPLSVLHTPGHTPGSITLLHHDTGDALVGDLLAGGMLRPDRPDLPFLGHDVSAIRAGVHRVLAAAPGRFRFGHGRPASAVSVARRFGPRPAVARVTATQTTATQTTEPTTGLGATT